MKCSAPRCLTPVNGKHHFFGYYGIPPWDASGKYFICLETDFQDHMPVLGEKARILLLDLEQGTHEVIAETRGWNFQQGAMLHWLPSDPKSKIIFNDCDEKHAFSRVLDVFTGEERTLPRPINGVAHHHDLAACVNFARLRRNRRVTSLPFAGDYSKGGVHPDDDGIFIMQLDTGQLDLIITLDEVWKANPHTMALPEDMLEELHMESWFNHVAFNHDDTRLHFLARHADVFKSLITSMWTVGTDGSDPFLLVDFYHDGKPLQLSHFEWTGTSDLVITLNWPDFKSKSHVKVRDRRGMDAWKTIAREKLTRDGHPHLNPSKTLMATDCYPAGGKRHVYIVDLATEDVRTVATFDNPPEVTGDVRCDPHPRWSRDGKQLCFDGLGEHGRQIYVMDVNG